ncbi:hypothetical protein MKZ38_010698 [Zalerion maritima]|uniref:Phosphoribosyltransferase domain-containing protein n=1 Tax=Zalerion maritima TaxID=339359 RepID=A0AAD5WSB5_9PEZI|nr:hypothetical protein MKZ38_010698 [Zalerion maritima]
MGFYFTWRHIQLAIFNVASLAIIICLLISCRTPKEAKYSFYDIDRPLLRNMTNGTCVEDSLAIPRTYSLGLSGVCRVSGDGDTDCDASFPASFNLTSYILADLANDASSEAAACRDVLASSRDIDHRGTKQVVKSITALLFVSLVLDIFLPVVASLMDHFSVVLLIPLLADFGMRAAVFFLVAKIYGNEVDEYLTDGMRKDGGMHMFDSTGVAVWLVVSLIALRFASNLLLLLVVVVLAVLVPLLLLACVLACCEALWVIKQDVFQLPPDILVFSGTPFLVGILPFVEITRSSGLCSFISKIPCASLLRNSIAIIVGLYGIPGCGKSHLLKQLKSTLKSHYQLFEGSEVLGNIVPGGVDAFKTLPSPEKASWREKAITQIQDACRSSGKIGVVADRITFWEPSQSTLPTAVRTEKYLEVYTHIFYLDVAAETVKQRRSNDKTRERTDMEVQRLETWMRTEKGLLRKLCLENGTLFHCARVADEGASEAVATLLEDIWKNSTPESSERRVEMTLTGAWESLLQRKEKQTMVVLDADLTLGPHDTSMMFWEAVDRATYGSLGITDCAVKRTFGSKMGYSYTALRQAAFTYSEMEPGKYNKICEEVSAKCGLYPEIRSLLKQVGESDHVSATVITSGISHIWQHVLAREGLPGVLVIGGGRVLEHPVVTPETKAMVVRRLKQKGIRAIVFGDSPLDLPMMKEADEAVVVVGEEKTRSTTMKQELSKAIDAGDIKRVSQALVPAAGDGNNIWLLLETKRLPLVCLDSEEFLQGIFAGDGRQRRQVAVLHATGSPDTQILATPMRDARIKGGALRSAYRDVGWYLGIYVLPNILGTETYYVPAVQGGFTDGYRVKGERRTLIVPLMRGGEPMAFGVADVMAGAMFLHASKPEDLTGEHLKGRDTVVLVDSVVNSGKSVRELVGRVRKLEVEAREKEGRKQKEGEEGKKGAENKKKIVVVAEAVQEGAIREEGLLWGLDGRRIANPRICLPQAYERTISTKMPCAILSCNGHFRHLIDKWHSLLSLPRQPHTSWYRARLADELRELEDAATLLHKLSETADVFYIISRAAHDGFPSVGRHGAGADIEMMSRWKRVMAWGYMLGKYTSRWGFWRTAGWLCGGCRRNGASASAASDKTSWRPTTENSYLLGAGDTTVREVVNPSKNSKVLVVARRRGFDEEKFLAVCRKLRWVWPLLP